MGKLIFPISVAASITKRNIKISTAAWGVKGCGASSAAKYRSFTQFGGAPVAGIRNPPG